MSVVKPQVKADIVGITYGLISKLVLRIAKTKTDANHRLFQLGEEVGKRVADEYSQRQTNSYKPEEVAAVLLKGVMKEYLGCQVQVVEKETKYQKTRFSIRMLVVLKENPICDYVVLPNTQEEEQLNYYSLIEGFISGCMASMCYHPTVRVLPQKEQKGEKGKREEGEKQESSTVLAIRAETVVEVEMWKEKEQD